MATQTKTQPTVEEATQKVTELGEQAFENGKKVGNAYLDSYEKLVLTLADTYEKAAAQTKIEWLETAVAAQAGLTRELTKAYPAAARELVS
jgi:hypothetical protein